MVLLRSTSNSGSSALSAILLFMSGMMMQVIAYLQSCGVVIDLAAMEVDTKATRSAGRNQ